MNNNKIIVKDKYTIKEKKAPEGYMLSTDTVKVVPADFGPDKSVTKTIKNTHTPKETPKKDTPKKSSSQIQVMKTNLVITQLC